MSKKEKKLTKYNKYQQGDVVMFQIDDKSFENYSNKGKSTYGDNENVVRYDGHTHTHAILAFGEATGHKHQVNMADMVKEAGVTLHMDNWGEAGVNVPKAFEVHNETVTLCHEEHNSIEIPPGKYVVRIVREFDHMTGRSRYVAD